MNVDHQFFIADDGHINVQAMEEWVTECVAKGEVVAIHYHKFGELCDLTRCEIRHKEIT